MSKFIRVRNVRKTTKGVKNVVKRVNECAGCETCSSGYCSQLNVERHYCDDCGNTAEYTLDGYELCEDCVSARLDDLWNELSLDEKAEIFELALNKID